MGHHSHRFPLLIGQQEVLTPASIFQGQGREGENTKARDHELFIVIPAGAT
jgi:hypothetical protein